MDAQGGDGDVLGALGDGAAAEEEGEGGDGGGELHFGCWV